MIKDLVNLVQWAKHSNLNCNTLSTQHVDSINACRMVLITPTVKAWKIIMGNQLLMDQMTKVILN